jgi:hypothetical protein
VRLMPLFTSMSGRIVFVRNRLRRVVTTGSSTFGPETVVENQATFHLDF